MDWEAKKSVVRGVCLKTKYGVHQQLERDIQILKRDLGDIKKDIPSMPERLEEWYNARRSLLDNYCRLEKHLYSSYPQRLHVESDTTGAMLARLVKQEDFHSPIPMMTDVSGQLVYTE
ncbi:hypothetical protein NDU88_007741 [Pleurodeles waltl]|uniref:Uncharacterized protein n=1 Tax=Pleurodeles waltl TaxID=8319 RepID=A0AAV7RRT6_PLEWA|nr:hypothetical protein NDU88_007741 [Pleurodeles waltl]